MRTILAIDLGTTLIKAVLFDESGKIIKSAGQKLPLINIGKNGIGQDPFLLWETVKTLVKKISKDTAADAEGIRTIGFSSQGLSIIPVDMNYKPLCNMISWLDIRAVREVREIEKKFTARDIFHITGKKLHESYSLPKILWLRNNEPEVYRRWSKEILCAFNIRPDILPSIKDAGSYRAPLIRNTAEELGLSKDVSVVTGAQDQKCAAIGAGIDENTAVISIGTCSAVIAEFPAPVFDEKLRIPLFSFLKKDSYVLEAVVTTTGIFKDFTDGYKKTRGETMEFKPDKRKVEFYDDIYRKYIELEKKIIGWKEFF